jgi:hypothetical protein
MKPVFATLVTLLALNSTSAQTITIARSWTQESRQGPAGSSVSSVSSVVSLLVTGGELSFGDPVRSSPESASRFPQGRTPSRS